MWVKSQVCLLHSHSFMTRRPKIRVALSSYAQIQTGDPLHEPRTRISRECSAVIDASLDGGECSCVAPAFLSGTNDTRSTLLNGCWRCCSYCCCEDLWKTRMLTPGFTEHSRVSVLCPSAPAKIQLDA